RQLLEDELEYGLLNALRLAQVAAKHAARPVEIAHRQRIVEVKLFVQMRNDGRIAVLTGKNHRGIAGQELLQPEDQERDEEERRNDRREALDEVVEHELLCRHDRSIGKHLASSPRTRGPSGFNCTTLDSRLRGNDEFESFLNRSKEKSQTPVQFSFNPCTRTSPSGIVRNPASLAVCAHSQCRWNR